ncbi:MAG: protein phosphatase 2C domain-containing protein [Bacillota bacterium]|nr:protein phosphatase 2C domain-containing protein [Bacillota bacterium]
MKIESIAITNVGKIRDNNEDNFFLCGRYKEDVGENTLICSCDTAAEEYLFGVCDGMGGAQYGELAALIAVKAMAKYAKHFDADCQKCIDEANGLICDEITNRGGRRIGTTFSALSIKDGVARGYNVGDSRIYMLRGGKLSQLSVDHTQVQMLVNQGIITPEAAKTHRDRHVLTQHLGIFPDEMIIEPYSTGEIGLQAEDMFLLCSDGLTDMVEDEKICEILSAGDDTAATANRLVDTALSNGGRDNVTVVLVKASKESSNEADLADIEQRLRNRVMEKFGKVNEALIAEVMQKVKERMK